MKIFVVDPSFFSLPYDTQLCAALAGIGHEVTLIGRRLRPYEEVRKSGFAIHPLFYGLSERLPENLRLLAGPLKGLEHALGMQRLIGLVRRERPDVLHWQWIVLPQIDRLYLGRLARLAPLVLTAHNSVPFHGTGSSWLMLKGHGEALRQASYHIPHTPSTARHLETQGIDSAHYSILPHPALDLPSPSTASAPRTDRVTRILFFGTIKPYKGVDILIEAALRLAGKRRDFHVTIAGRPFFPLNDLFQRIETAGAKDLFTFDLRHLPDQALSNHLAATDIVVFPYREIDASGALACASQFGKPIVASAIGVFADPPVSDHVALLPKENPQALELELERLIARPQARKRLAALSRELKTKMYSWERFALDCTAIYRHLLAERQGQIGK